ncbi:hypothetical protein MNBD_GAMMA15-473, partial [hydrothermal vent metagenome]
AGPGQASVRSLLDRNTVYEGDTFTLTIEADSRQSGVQPALEPLEKDFEVLGTSTSTQISIINGRRSDNTRWQIQLQPRRNGRLTIPALTVGNEQTAPLELNVTEAPQQVTTQTGQHVFIEAEAQAAGKQTYVQQQIPYTIRLFYDANLQEGKLSAPELKDAVIEQLGEDQRYTTVRNGQQYNVVERHFVISPEKSGALRIPPATFHGRIAVASQGGRSSRGVDGLMERFFSNSPFSNNRAFGGVFGSASKSVTVRSRSIDMEIKPRPATTAGNWLPAEAVTLHDSWTDNPPEFRVGEPVARTITIKTRGLAGSQIPELDMEAPANTRLYPEATKHESRTDGTTIFGVRTQTLTYIAGAQGMLDLPAVTLDWWDTRQNKAASTTLPGWQFKVLPGAASAAPEPQAAAPASKTTPAADTTPPETETRTPWVNWRWLTAGSSVLFVLIALVTLMVRHRQQRIAPSTEKQPPQTAQQDIPNRKSVLHTLQKACASNNRHAAARTLLTLGQTYWPDEPPRSLNALTARISKGQAQLRELDRSLYAADEANWNGTALWTEFKQGFEVKKKDKNKEEDGLGPLYPQHN